MASSRRMAVSRVISVSPMDARSILSEPELTTTVTLENRGTISPAAFSWEITVPSGTVSEASCSICITRSSSLSSASASSWVFPSKSGIRASFWLKVESSSSVSSSEGAAAAVSVPEDGSVSWLEGVSMLPIFKKKRIAPVTNNTAAATPMNVTAFSIPVVFSAPAS